MYKAKTVFVQYTIILYRKLGPTVWYFLRGAHSVVHSYTGINPAGDARDISPNILVGDVNGKVPTNIFFTI